LSHWAIESLGHFGGSGDREAMAFVICDLRFAICDSIDRVRGVNSKETALSTRERAPLTQSYYAGAADVPPLGICALPSK